jgi:hypothetical protein
VGILDVVGVTQSRADQAQHGPHLLAALAEFVDGLRILVITLAQVLERSLDLLFHDPADVLRHVIAILETEGHERSASPGHATCRCHRPGRVRLFAATPGPFRRLTLPSALTSARW